MKSQNNQIIYQNDEKEFVLEGKQFIYETNVFLRYKKYFSLMNSQLYCSDKFIENIIPTFKVSPHVTICSELHTAPKSWLLDNGYVEYHKPEKIKKVKSNKKENG